MCGITGVVNLNGRPPVETETLLRMLGMIRHRGPDGFGIYRDANAALGNARLSIIDLSTGDQPIGNEDGSLWIVYNGEVFNYVELRPELEARGHRFSTCTDTEVVLHLYEDYGPACLQYLNGQFALAIWDANKKTLFLARDRLGVRPLFYTFFDGRLVFGSEIKSILAYPGMSGEIDRAALAEVFAYWSVQPPRTIFEGIFELPPAHTLLYQDGQVKVEPYWRPDFTVENPPREQETYEEQLEALLIDATRIRLRADVPVGAYLSGGLDSSLTTAMIQKYTDSRLDTFSISFSDQDFDEQPYQRRMAEYLGTGHHEVYCTHEDIGGIFPAVIWHTETPVLRTAPAPLFLLSKLVHSNRFKVVMTGEGADEMLAGYDIFKEMKLRRFWARNPESGLRPLLLRRLYPDIKGLDAAGSAYRMAFFKRGMMNTGSLFYSHELRWSNTARAWRFLKTKPGLAAALEPPSLRWPEGTERWSTLGQAQFLEIMTFLSPYLLSSQGDRMAMAHSVEGRYPFLDYRVVEFAGRLPPNLKLNVLTEKFLLKRLGSKYLPGEIWQRVKRPYRAPVHRSFFPGAPIPWVEELLSERRLVQSGLFDPDPVRRLAAKVSGGSSLSEMEDMALVGILSAQLVDEQFVRNFRMDGMGSMPPVVKVVDRVGLERRL